MSTDPIARWHALAAARDAAALADLVADDAVFQSPAVHTPQAGKPLVLAYLRAALAVLGNDSFRYLGEWRGERSAVLEFEATLDGMYLNGVDMIRWNEAGKITHFKVMVRPVKGLQALIGRMAERLQKG
jgi:hypothetical protein